MSRLVSLGADEQRRVEFDQLDHSVHDLHLARVARVDRGEVLVLRDQDDLRVMSDSHRSQAVTAPASGDWVAVRQDPEVGWVIDRVLERRTAIVRRDPAEQITDQVLVSNIDTVAVVHGLDQPANTARIERFLILAIDSGAEPVVVLAKSDLACADFDIGWLESICPVIHTSVVHGSGIEELRSQVGGAQTMVLIGPSGVGKSSLVNALVGSHVAETTDVRASDRRGRHTTTVRELSELPGGGMVIDTPGIRAIGLWAADVALEEVFADIAEAATSCRFRDCTHRSEPDCAVNTAIEAGGIDPVRLARYQLLWQELAEQAAGLERQKYRPRPSQKNRRRR